MVTLDSDDRAVSPVVGVVLLVAISVTLAGIGAMFVLGLADEQDPAPEVKLDIEQTESGTISRYDLVHESGDTLHGDRIKIQGVANENALSGKLRAGGTVEVLPTTTEIHVVWIGDDRTSYRLDSFEVDGANIPAVDEGCDWVNSKTNGGTDSIKIDGKVVDCDVTTDDFIKIQNGGIVIGQATTNTEYVDADDAQIYGDTVVEKNVDADSSVLAGDVEAKNKPINLQDGEITGDANAKSSDVKLTNGTVGGSVSASKVIDIQAGSSVDGDVVSTNDKNIDIDDSTIGGSVVGDGTVNLDDTTVDGHVYADSSDFKCTDSTINGQDCGSYSPKDPASW